jgi:hypothetical protein
LGVDVSQATNEGSFALTTSPAVYLPRPDTERALLELEEWALNSVASSIWFTGPPGMGKTLLLKVLADRLSDRRLCAYVSYPVLPPKELAALVLDVLGESAAAAPQDRIVGLAEGRAEQGGLLLLIDDAMLMPQATRSALDDWYGESNGALRSVLAATFGPSLNATGGFSGDAWPSLDEPLRFEESRAMLAAAMGRSQLGAEARALFDPATVQELHASASGVPTRLLIEAGRVLFARRDEVATRATAAPVEPAAELAEPPSVATRAGLVRESGPVPGGTRDRAPLTRFRSQRRRIPTIAAWCAGVFGGGVLASLIAIQLLGADLGAADAALAAAPVPALEKSAVEGGAGAAEARAAVATRIGALDFHEPPATRSAVPAPAALPAVAAAPPTSPALPARAAATDGGQIVTDGVIRDGEWLAASFRRLDIPMPIITVITQQVGDLFDFTRSRPGHRYTVTLDGAGELVAFRYVIGPGDELRIHRTGQDYRAVRSAPAAR